jgi:Mg-chelatase subunit ChlD
MSEQITIAIKSSYYNVYNFKKLIATFCLLCIANGLLCQDFKAWQEKTDFGEVQRTASFKTGFVVENKGRQKIFIMRADAPSKVEVSTSKKILQPGDTALIAISYRPTAAGKFLEKVNIHYSTSDKPLSLQIEGKLNSLETNDLNACVNFAPKGETGANIISASVDRSFYFTNAKDGSKIQQVTLVAYQLSTGIPSTLESNNGVIRSSFIPGRYRFEAISNNFIPQVTEMYIGYNSQNHTFVLAPATEQVAIIDKIEAEEVVTKSQANEFQEQEGELNTQLYAPNNIILLIDISRSMKEENRLNLLQKNIGRMLEPLRAIDTITVITYAESVNTLVPPQSASNKKAIKQKTDSLVAKGATAGSLAIKSAYEMAELHYINGGNNLILLASDGIFRLNKEDRIMIQKNAERQENPIFISVVGLGTNRNTLLSLREIAATGKGTFMHLQEESTDADALLEEIKRRSLRR